MFSRRAEWSAGVNQLTRVREELQRSGREIVDLTISNPTQAGIDYPLDELADIMARASRARYRPDPLGLPSARSAIAQHLGCDADDVVVTASTSEAYSHLFKLLTDPGQEILTATPTYPLLEHLASLELITLRTFPLELQRRWEIHETALRSAMTSATRAIVIVNPNNPTGSYVNEREQASIAAAGVPVISDEVFFDYDLRETERSPSFASSGTTLVFTLGGLSKSAGLPHYKLGWIRVSGPDLMKREAMGALELICDNFLSVSTPVQEALPELLTIAPRIRDGISQRTKRNLATLRNEIAAVRSAALLPVEGGWSAVIRMPRMSSDEDFAIALLRDDAVAVHPGYFFDFAGDGYIVVSLLTPPDAFDEGVKRILRRMPS